MSLIPSNSIGVKICGITNKGDAEMCIQAGVDALGFNFYRGSKRCIEWADFDWIRELEGSVDRVAVVVNASADDLLRLRDSGCFEWIQFHGDETQEDCHSYGFPNWIRAVRAKDAAALACALKFSTPYLLVDSWSSQAYGGTGNLANWSLVRDFAKHNFLRHMILAGGLTPKNVAEAIRVVQPAAVDVAGGVELSPRSKDLRLVSGFIAAVRAASGDLGDLGDSP